MNNYNFPHLARENGNREEIAGKTDKSNTGHQNALGKYIQQEGRPQYTTY